MIINFKEIVRCSECFIDEGLKILAYGRGVENNQTCMSCGKANGAKLSRQNLIHVAELFFVKGSYHKSTFGGASTINFSDNCKTDVEFSDHLKSDVKIFEKELGVGFYHYGPPLWMLGYTEPLEELQDLSKRNEVIDRIFEAYPSMEVTKEFTFYRIRKNPRSPNNILEYDSPPIGVIKEFTRLDTAEIHVLYGAFDLPICLHECRVMIEDELYLATLEASKKLKFLDISRVISEGVNAFESLDIAMTMLFGAQKHSYEICQAIAKEALLRGYDGIIYPSYFTEIHSGLERIVTSYGLPLRTIPKFQEVIQRQIYPNIAIFGHPIAEGKVKVKCINKINLKSIEYDYVLGPVKK